jgi:hypothetical protein
MSANDYYPFHMTMRSFNAGSEYRYGGSGGQEKDDEIYGDGNSYAAEYWQYDSRLGRRWNVDPLFMKYPNNSPYLAFNDLPTYFIDQLGLEGEPPQYEVQKGDNLTKIAKENGTTISDIKIANSGIDWTARGENQDVIDAGEVLNLPGYAGPELPQEGGIYHGPSLPPNAQQENNIPGNTAGVGFLRVWSRYEVKPQEGMGYWENKEIVSEFRSS